MSILLLLTSPTGGGGGSLSLTKASWTIGIDNLLIPDGYVAKTGTWLNELGSESNLHLSVDETVASDTDYIYDTLPTNNNYYEFSLSDPSGTPLDGDIVIFWRGECIGTTMSVQVQLRQGTSTVIAQSSQTLQVGARTYYYILTPAERSNITDWNNLRLRIIEVIS
jgi:hypothetical protein